MVLVCRANVTSRDLTLHKFKDLFSPINHIQNNHIYSFLIHSFSPSCWFLLWVSDQSFIFSFGNNFSKTCWRLEEFFSLWSQSSSLSFLLLVLHSTSDCFIEFSFAKRTQIYYLSLLPHAEIFCLLCPLGLCFPGCRKPFFHIRANFLPSQSQVVGVWFSSW